MQKANIGIIGYGIVGQALASGFHKHNIRFYDKYKDTDSLESVVENSDFIFICLPTPMFEDESGIDLSIITDTIDTIAPLTNNTSKIVIIKSTVIPGTTISLAKKYPETHFAFNPEFLTEKNFIEDFKNPDRTIIGTFNETVSAKLILLYKTQFPKTPIFSTDPTSAEVVKYMANAFLSLKVAFANQMYDMCQKLDLMHEEVFKMVAMDKRIGDYGLTITTERGFGGKCFPKDDVALLALAEKMGINLSLLKEAWEYNKNIRKVKDWKEIPFAVSESKED